MDVFEFPIPKQWLRVDRRLLYVVSCFPATVKLVSIRLIVYHAQTYLLTPHAHFLDSVTTGRAVAPRLGLRC
jgi:hypothetical protein